MHRRSYNVYTQTYIYHMQEKLNRETDTHEIDTHTYIICTTGR
jgi:hypothetical protein